MSKQVRKLLTTLYPCLEGYVDALLKLLGMLTPWSWGGRDWFQDCDSCSMDLQAYFAESEESGGEWWCCHSHQALRTESLTAETEEVSSQQNPRRQHVQILHCSTAWGSIRLTEMGAAEQEHRYEKAAAVSQFVKGFYKYSKCWLQQSEWFFRLSLYHRILLSGLTTSWGEKKSIWLML